MPADAILGEYTFTYRVSDSDTDTSLSDSADLFPSIFINPPLSFGTVTIADQTYTQGTPIADLTLPAATDGAAPLAYSIEGASLPIGLTFDADTRVLMGTPTGTQLATLTYTVTDSAGATDTLSLRIRVRSAFSFTGPPDLTLTYTAGTPIPELTLAAVTGGTAPLTYFFLIQSEGGANLPGEVNLPDGLTVDSATAVLGGTPTTVQSRTGYAYFVRDSNGLTSSVVGVLIITILEPPPVTFGTTTITPQNYISGTAVNLTLPAATGGYGTLMYAITEPLPDGLTFTAATRVLDGTPTTLQAATPYTYTATDSNPNGANTVQLPFTIAIQPPSAAITSTNPDPLVENTLDGATLTVTLANTAYENPLPANLITLNTEATTAGVTVTAARDSDTQATLTLAFDRTDNDFDDNLDIRVTVPDAVHTGAGNLTTGAVTATAVVESSDATLSVLTLSGGAVLTPAFAAGTLTYTANVANSVAEIMVTPTAADDGATLTVNGDDVNSGTASGAIALTAGMATDIDVLVTAEDRVATQTYTLAVTRAAVPTATISATAPGTLTEATLDGETVTVMLANTEYVPGTLAANLFTVTLSGGATGVSVSAATRTSSVLATLTLAYGGIGIDANTTLGVTVLEAVHTGTGDLDTATIPVTATPPSLPDASFIVPENAAADTDVGTPLMAAEFPSGTQTWAIVSGNDDGDFNIDRATGQLSVVANDSINFEDTASYTLVVSLTIGAATAQATVTVMVSDEIELPSAPAAPTVTPEVESLAVTWTAPDNNGPAITSYDVQYRTGSDAFTLASPGPGTATSLTITGLTAATLYEVQVRAVNAEGDGPYSALGTGTPLAPPTPTATISAPTTAIAEAALSGTELAVTLSNTEYMDAGTLAAAQFTINHGTGASGVTVGNVVRTGNTVATLTLAYTSGIDADTTLGVTVVAAAHTGDDALTTDNTVMVTATPPSLPDATFTVAENTAAATDVGTPLMAAEFPSGTQTWAIVSGNDDGDFNIDRATGQLSVVANDSINFEDTASYTLVVSLTIGAATAQATVTVMVSDEIELPSAPAAPTVTPEVESLAVTWTAPANNGPAITSYDVQYRTGSDAFTLASPGPGTATSLTITGLTAATLYEVQVRAVNAEGDGPYSALGTGTPMAPPTLTATISAPTTAIAEAALSGTTLAVTLSNTEYVGTLAAVQFTINHGTGASGVTVSNVVRTGNTVATLTLAYTSGIDADTTLGVTVVAAAHIGDDALTTDNTVMVTATAPSLPDATFTVAENTAAATDVGTPLMAAEFPSGTQTWAIVSGNDDGDFAIDAVTGQLSVAANDSINFEDTESYTLVVSLTIGTAMAQATVTVTVSDEIELPSAPAAPTVTPEVESLAVTWTAPDNNGPAITSYDVRYRVGSTGAYTDAADPGTATSLTITGLTASTLYEVQVRAVNAEGDGPYSAPGSGTPLPPTAPSLPEATFDVAENADANATVGAPLVPANFPSGTQAWAIVSGNTGNDFAIDPVTGQLSVVAADSINFEDTASYTLMVSLTIGAATAQATVTVMVSDENEVPSAPAAPTVTPEVESLAVAWTAPANRGPAITGYDVRYRVGSTGAYTDAADPGTATSLTITGLTASTLYEVQVRAVNAEGDGPYSAPGSGTPLPPTAPSLPEATFDVAENADANATVGAPLVPANFPSGTQAWAIVSGNTGNDFAIDPVTGQLSVVAADSINFEDTASYTLMVSLTIGAATAQATVTVMVSDENEVPSAPAAPTVTPEVESLAVAWTAPANRGPAITGYDVRYRVGSTGAYTDAADPGTATSLTITGLTASTLYEVQVRAVNAEGDGPYSAPGSGTPLPPTAPSLPEATFDVAENADANATVGAPLVPANFPSGTQAWAIVSGNTGNDFAIDPVTGQLSVVAADSINFEDTASYTLMVSLTIGAATAQATVTVMVSDENEVPSAPAAPTVTPEVESLNVSWTAPANSGPAITGYDVQYRTGSDAFTLASPGPGTATSLTITGLTAATLYEVQVRAVNAEGDGPYSALGTGTPLAPPTPTATISAPTTAIAEAALSGTELAVTLSNTEYMDAGTLAAAQFTINHGTGASGVTVGNVVRTSPTVATLMLAYTSGIDADTTLGVTVVAAAHIGDDALTTDNTVMVTATPPSLAGATFIVLENTAAATDVGTPLMAAEFPSGTQAWAIVSGNDGGDFNIDTATGQLSVVANDSINFEDTESYTLVVSLTIGTAMAQATVTVTVSDEIELPSAPAAPTVTPEVESLNVSWTAPDNNGPAITGYDVEYRLSSLAPSGAYTDAGHSGTTPGITITGLTGGVEYQVQVRAVNAEGDGPYSALGTGTPLAPPTPTATISAPTTAIAEAALSGTELAVTLSNTEYMDAGTLAAAQFTINHGTGASGVTVGNVVRTSPTVATLMLAYTSGIDADTTLGVTVVAAAHTGDDALTTDNTVMVTATPPSLAGATFIVLENTAAATDVGTPLMAAEFPSGTQTWAIVSGNTGGDFAIDPVTGQLSVVAADSINFEDTASYTLMVSLTIGTATAQATVTVMVSDEDEPPLAPAAPTVTPEVESLAVAWTAPDNNGPAITGYDVEYRLSSSAPSGAYTDAGHSGTTLGITITGLTGGVEYQVRVRAVNAEGNGSYSPLGTGTPLAPPTLTATISAPTTAIAEAALSGTELVVTLSNTEYVGTLAAVQFTINHGTGASGVTVGNVVRTGNTVATLMLAYTSGIDADTTLGVTVVAAAHTGDDALTTDNTVMVTATAPSLAGATFSVAENATAATTVGTPLMAAEFPSGTQIWAIVSGNDDGDFNIDTATGQLSVAANDSINFEDTASYTLMVSLTIGTAMAQATVTVMVSDENEPPLAPAAPTVTPAVESLAVAWTAPANSGPAITGYDVEYRLSSSAPSGAYTDAGHSGTTPGITITGLTGGVEYQVRVRAVNAEGNGSYSPLGTGTPLAPLTPTATISAPTTAIAEAALSGTELVVTLSNTEYVGTLAAAQFTINHGTGASGVTVGNVVRTGNTVATLTLAYTSGIDADTTLGVTVAAAAHTGDDALTTDNMVMVTATPPSLPDATFSVAENATAATTVGTPLMAAEFPSGTQIWAIVSGNDDGDFNIDTATGQLSVAANDSINFEDTASYTLMVSLTIGTAMAQATVTVMVSDENEPPLAPAAPTVTPAVESLAVAWTAPANSGPAITGYDVRYRVGSTGAYTDAADPGTATRLTITGLAAGTAHEVQVRAVNAEGDGPYSVSGSGTPLSAGAPTASITTTAPLSLTEANLNGAMLTVTLSNATYMGTLTTSQFTLTGTPGAATISVASVTAVSGSDTQAVLELSYTGTDLDSDLNLRVVVDAAAHSGTNPLTTGAVAVDDNVAPVIVNPGPQSYVQNAPITALTITVNDADGDGAGTSPTVTLTSLPTGLVFDGTDQVTGTPTELGDTVVSITADDGVNDRVTATFTITVTSSGGALSFGGATIDAQTYTVNTAITDLTLPVVTGGTGPYGYALLGMPSGLSFNAMTRVLSGTPDTEQGATTYTYTATDSALSPAAVTLSLMITVEPGSGVTGGPLEVARSEAMEMTLGAFGRSFTSGAVEVLGERFSSGAGGSQLTFGGRTLSLESLRNGQAAANAGDESDNQQPVPAAAGGQQTSVGALFAGSAFQLSLNEGDAAGVGATTLWARGSVGNYEGEPEDGFQLDGDIVSGYLGLDYRASRRTLVGVAVSHSRGDADFSSAAIADGEVETELTSILPYVQWQPHAGLSLWGLVGYGLGESEITDSGESRKTDVEMQTAALGARGKLWSGGRADVALKASALTVELESDSEQNLSSVTTRAHRLRMALAGNRHGVASARGGRFGQRFELGLRWDLGDVETGAGADLGAGVEYANPRSGTRLRLDGHYLLVHEESDFEAWEVSAEVGIAPSLWGRGVRFALQPGWDSAGARQRMVMDFTDVLGPAWRGDGLKLELYGEHAEDHEFGLEGSIRY